MPHILPDDVTDSDLDHHELALERGDWPEPITAPFLQPDEALSQGLPLEPASFPPEEADQPVGWDEVEPY